IDAGVTIAPEHEGANVAVLGIVEAHQLDRRLLELVARIAQVHAVDLAGIDQPLCMLLQAEDRRTVLRLITAHAFEQARRITEHMRGDVNRGIFPGYEFAVVPDFFVIIDRHSFLLTLLGETPVRLPAKRISRPMLASPAYCECVPGQEVTLQL